jgi:hypothetical protein
MRISDVGLDFGLTINPQAEIRNPKSEMQKSEWWLLGATRQYDRFAAHLVSRSKETAPGPKAVVSLTRPTYRGKRKHDPIHCGRLPEAGLKACATSVGT